MTGESPLHDGRQLNLGNPVTPVGTPPIEFNYTLADETLITGIVRHESISFRPLTGDYYNNGVADAADYVVWPKTNVNASKDTAIGAPTSAARPCRAHHPIWEPQSQYRQAYR